MDYDKLSFQVIERQNYSFPLISIVPQVPCLKLK
jgi:hypothetical protein